MEKDIKKYYNEYHQKSNKKTIIIRKNDNRSSIDILNMMKVRRGEKIIDIGCGKGELLIEAEKRGLICLWH